MILILNRQAPGYITAKNVSYYKDESFREAVRAFRKDSDFEPEIEKFLEVVEAE